MNTYPGATSLTASGTTQWAPAPARGSGARGKWGGFLRSTGHWPEAWSDRTFLWLMLTCSATLRTARILRRHPTTDTVPTYISIYIYICTHIHTHI